MRPDCEGFSRPFRSLKLPNGTVRILAEPSNNSNLRTLRQLFDRFSMARSRIALPNRTVREAYPWLQAGAELAMLGFLHDRCRCSHVLSFPPLLFCNHCSLTHRNYL